MLSISVVRLILQARIAGCKSAVVFEKELRLMLGVKFMSLSLFPDDFV